MWNYEFMAVYALSLTFMNNMTLQVVSYDNKMTVMINNSAHIQHSLLSMLKYTCAKCLYLYIRQLDME